MRRLSRIRYRARDAIKPGRISQPDSPPPAPVRTTRFLAIRKHRRLREKRVLEREGREHLWAVGRDQDLLLELYPFGAAVDTDLALDAERQVLFKHAVIPPLPPIDRIGQIGILVRQADAVCGTIPIINELVGNFPSLFTELSERNTGLQKF